MTIPTPPNGSTIQADAVANLTATVGTELTAAHAGMLARLCVIGQQVKWDYSYTDRYDDPPMPDEMNQAIEQAWVILATRSPKLAATAYESAGLGTGEEMFEALEGLGLIERAEGGGYDLGPISRGEDYLEFVRANALGHAVTEEA